MSSAILNFIIKFAVRTVFNEIKSNLFKPDTTVVDNIVGGFNNLERLIRQLDYLSKLHGPMTKIYYWVDRTKTVVDNLRNANTEANREAYKNVIDALKSENDGIRFQTYSLYSTVMSIKTPVTTDGLLRFWADEAYKKLANENDTSYHMYDYIYELDTNISAIAALLHHGMELSMFISATEQDAEAFRNEAKQRIENFRNTLYQRLYPPALRQFKSSYDDPGTFLTDGRWFNLYDEPVTTNRNFLTIHNYWIREISLHKPGGDSSAKLRAFRFGQDKGAVLPRPALDREDLCVYELSGGDTDVILFKLIPLQVEAPTTRTPVKLIPYQQSNGSRTRADKSNTWGTTWRLAQTYSPQ
ncbi:hypothetical protein PT974_04058 [Cladobotryum mycophilum]|uniref:Uncharacterized protein n=1 Tax=Cladobotryum mycophilum TaxID=491253 RepID=A0ABR0SU32_9HYPO